MSTPDMIVGEVSKTWINGAPAQLPDGGGAPLLLSQHFERMIAVNAARGYKLHSFHLHRMMVNSTQMNETLIAVFERVL